MAETKTRPTGASIDAYLASRATPEQLADAQVLIALCSRVTGQPPTMWGPSIVGFGQYTYTYASGHSGDAPLVGLAVRGRDLVVYITAESAEQADRLARLGKHRMGKSCLYIKRLSDLDPEVLEALVAHSVAEIKQLYPHAGDA